MESAKSNDARSEPRADEVMAQLERIMASGSFNLPDRARRFLRYVVTETIEGRAQYLKAYTIATVVFGRRDFDAQGDPAVRIEAGRIRRELELYYLVTGPKEPVIITIPKGGYVPTFERGSEISAVAIEAQPVVEPAEPTAPPASSPALRQVLPLGLWSSTRLVIGGFIAFSGAVGLAIFAHLASVERVLPSFGDGRAAIAVERFDYPPDDKELQAVSQGMTSELIAKLVKFNEIIVIDATDGSNADQQLNARYVLEGGLRKNGATIRSSARLIRQEDGAVIWASKYDTDLNIQSSLKAETEVAEKMATAVAQPFGVIFSSDTTSVGGWEAYDCALAYYSYRRAMTATALSNAQSCLSSQTDKYPKDATSLAMLALTQLDQVRFAQKLGTPAPEDGLERASKLAYSAFRIEPQNARVLQALMLSHFFARDVDAALKAGAAAYSLNPNDTEVAGEYGLRLAMSGQWDQGCELVSRAVNLGAGPDGYYEVGMALCAFIRGDLEAAELWARMSDLNYSPMHRMVLASILGALGKKDRAQVELDWLNKNAPTLMPNIKREIGLRLSRSEDQEKVLSGLRSAGADVAVDTVLK